MNDDAILAIALTKTTMTVFKTILLFLRLVCCSGNTLNTSNVLLCVRV